MPKNSFFRNPFCPTYTACLDQAAKKNSSLKCDKCTERKTRVDDYELTSGELRGIVLLIRAIFNIQVDEDDDDL